MSTPTPHHEWVEIAVAGAAYPMPTYVAVPTHHGHPDAGKRPAVIVLEEIFGVNSHIRDVANRVAALGYVALAPDYHYRHAPRQELAYDAAGVAKGKTLVPLLKTAEIHADLAATIAYAKSRHDVDGAKLGCIGFCIGGHLAYLAAATTEIHATAAFYGGGIATFGLGDPQPTVSRTASIGGTIVCFFGAEDKAIPLPEVDTIRQALMSANIASEVIVYDSVGHGFFCDQRASFDASRAAAAWTRVTELFAAELRTW